MFMQVIVTNVRLRVEKLYLDAIYFESMLLLLEKSQPRSHGQIGHVTRKSWQRTAKKHLRSTSTG